jgi:hypothetical protein
MFTRALFGHDMLAQQRLLAATADLVDNGVIRTTVANTITGLNAEQFVRRTRRSNTVTTSGRWW